MTVAAERFRSSMQAAPARAMHRPPTAGAARGPKPNRPIHDLSETYHAVMSLPVSTLQTTRIGLRGFLQLYACAGACARVHVYIKYRAKPRKPIRTPHNAFSRSQFRHDRSLGDLAEPRMTYPIQPLAYLFGACQWTPLNATGCAASTTISATSTRSAWPSAPWTVAFPKRRLRKSPGHRFAPRRPCRRVGYPGRSGRRFARLTRHGRDVGQHGANGAEYAV